MSDKNKFLILILSLQFAFLGLIGLDWIGLGIPILRQAIGFIYLTFIPGLLFLSILKIKSLGRVEIILYSVGLSLSFLMFIGALINSFYPLIGVLKPISKTPLIITISIVTLLLWLICYIRNKDRSKSFSINVYQIFSPFTLSFSFLPFLAVFGTYLLNFYDNNIILLILLPLISIIPLFVAFDRIGNKDKYPFVVWIISISLLLHNSLIGQFVSWGDSEVEYLISNLVLSNGFWDKTVPTITNSLLSIAILHPIYSVFCSIELTWVYKVVYPFLFSVAPVALYIAFRNQTNDKVAFLSSSLFMFSFMFFTVLSRNTRTGLSLLFLSLLILLITDNELKGVKKATLSLIFLLSIVVTYYGVSYMLILSLFPVVLLHYLDKNRDESRLITLTFASLFVVFSIAWYMYISGSSSFNTLVGFGKNFVNQFMEFLTYPRSSPTFYLKKQWNISLEVVKYLSVLFMIFIAIGILDLVYRVVKGEKISFSKDYSFLSMVFSLFLLVTLSPLPGNVQRILQISLVFLAPFSAVGSIRLFNITSRIFKHPLDKEDILKIFSFLLLILLLFDSGFISATLTHDLNPNELIHKKYVITEENIAEKKYFYSLYISQEDFISASWLKNHKNKNLKIIYFSPHAGSYHTGGPLLHYAEIVPKTYGGKIEAIRIENSIAIRGPSYVYLSYENVIEKIFLGKNEELLDYDQIYSKIEKENKIYTNGGSEIYFKE